MDPPPAPQASPGAATPAQPTKPRSESFSQKSDTSQTAAEYNPTIPYTALTRYADTPDSFIRDQMQLEADAREALPYVRHNAPPCYPLISSNANMAPRVSRIAPNHLVPFARVSSPVSPATPVRRMQANRTILPPVSAIRALCSVMVNTHLSRYSPRGTLPATAVRLDIRRPAPALSALTQLRTPRAASTPRRPLLATSIIRTFATNSADANAIMTLSSRRVLCFNV